MIALPHLDLGSYLPDVGELYSIDTTLLGGADPQARREGVVVGVPAGGQGRITVALRASAPGVPGEFGHLRTVAAGLWTPASVTYLDRLQAARLAELIAGLGQSGFFLAPGLARLLSGSATELETAFFAERTAHADHRKPNVADYRSPAAIGEAA